MEKAGRMKASLIDEISFLLSSLGLAANGTPNWYC